MNNLNIIIADDHPIVLFGIRKSLEQIEWVNVVGEFEDSTSLINNLSKIKCRCSYHRPICLVINMVMVLR